MFKVELITLEWILQEKLRVKNLWQSDMQCWGLNTRCSSEGPIFSHLVPNWWNCLGWSEPLWSGTLLEEVGYWGKAMMFSLSAPLPVHSLPPNCNTINQLLAPATHVPPPPGAKCSLPWHILTLWMSKTLLTCSPLNCFWQGILLQWQNTEAEARLLCKKKKVEDYLFQRKKCFIHRHCIDR